MSFSIELYNNLITLANDEDSPFYLIEHIGPYDGATYHVFSYRLGSYSDFLKPSALECRGHMFRIENGNPVLVSLPFPKFFNLNENPFTMDLDFSEDNVEYIAYKEDGSLITTYLDANGDLRLKSKTSLTSTMAVDSMELLPNVVTPFASHSLLEHCEALERSGHTVIMEYVSPNNRIVLPYENCDLVVLGVRERETGKMFSYNDFISIGLHSYVAENYLEKVEDVRVFIDNIHNMKGIEGFVIRLKDGTMVKCKTGEYVSLHHSKDSITAPRRLMDVVLQEASDDLRQMFSDDSQALAEIENMERYVVDVVTHLVKPSERFYDENHALERKQFAIKAQQELRPDQFTLAMARYGGKEIDYKEYVSRNHKKYLADYKTTLSVKSE